MDEPIFDDDVIVDLLIEAEEIRERVDTYNEGSPKLSDVIEMMKLVAMIHPDQLSGEEYLDNDTKD